ncbi:unnamed protein product [Symbiodinium sp. CCMP2592]|nr:unnamed protein product [Symbiodinium sp. CCMP2592]
MGKGRMKEVETWHSFMETLSSWLALQEEAFVRELQLCIPVKKEIVQADLNPETAARSSKLFYYLTQSLAKWERGSELLRSCSKRQGQSACGYEVIRTITSQYSIVSRMEAVFVREQALKLYQHVGHLKRPTDLIRHLEDSFSKSEAKLSNFPELLLSEADRCSVLLQSLGAEVRQYVVLHGSSSNWEALRRTLTYYEEQLRLCEAPGSSGRALQEKLCDYCGKKGHTADKCWQRQKEERERGGAPKGKGKGDKGKPKGKGDQTPKGSGTPRGSEKGKGDKGKGDKGKDKGKKQKKKKGQPGKGRSLTEPESEAESGGSATVMAMRFSFPGRGSSEPSSSERRVLRQPEKPEPSALVVPKPGSGPEGSPGSESRGSESMGSLGSRMLKYGDVAHVCKALETTPGDLWLVDSGATCHIVSDKHLSGFRVVKKYDRTANLFNASGGAIVVSGVVDLEVHFGDVFLRLEEVLVADVGFNVVSPWTGSERGWKTYLAKSGSRLYKGNGKKSIKLMGASRAWWALSGRSKGRGKENSSRRPPKGIEDMEIDALKDRDLLGSSKESTAGPQKPGEGILKKGRKTSEEDESGRHALAVPDSQYSESDADGSIAAGSNCVSLGSNCVKQWHVGMLGLILQTLMLPNVCASTAHDSSAAVFLCGEERLSWESAYSTGFGEPLFRTTGGRAAGWGTIVAGGGRGLEAGRRWEHAETLGLAKVSVDSTEPIPLLSHLAGIPANMEDAYDAPSLAFCAPGHALRALCSPAATMLGPIGLPDLEHPAAWLPATPVIPVTAAYPEEPVRASRPKMVESEAQCIIGQQEWEVWLGRCLEGKSLAEYGLHMVDVEFAVRVTELLEAPRAARAAWKRRFQEPNPVSMLHYIFHCRAVLQTYLATPAGYKGLVGGRSSLLVKVPQSVTSLELKTAWAFLDSGIYLRVARYYRRKREEERLHEARESMRAARAKSAAIPQGGVVDTTSSSSDEESLLLGEGELTALNRAQGQEDLSDLAIWRTLEELTGQRLSQLDGYVGAADEGNQPAEAGQPAPPSPASSMPPGELVATAFNLPRVSAPTLPEGMQREDYRRHGVNIPPSVPKRSRLPTPPRAMSAAASGSATGQTAQERAFVLSPPSLSHSQLTAQVRQALEEGQRLLE